MGSVVTFAEAEHANGIFDGYLAACAVGAGTSRAWDGGLAHLLAYKVAFGMPASWGTPGDVRNDLDYQTEVLPKLLFADTADPGYVGKLEGPMLTLHTQVDTLVPPAHESAYAATVASAGRSADLYQAFTSGQGHRNFTGPQLLTAVAALDHWVKDGVKPTAASFPAALGFLPGFVPPAWPQP